MLSGFDHSAVIVEMDGISLEGFGIFGPARMAIAHRDALGARRFADTGFFPNLAATTGFSGITSNRFPVLIKFCDRRSVMGLASDRTEADGDGEREEMGKLDCFHFQSFVSGLSGPTGLRLRTTSRNPGNIFDLSGRHVKQREHVTVIGAARADQCARVRSP